MIALVLALIAQTSEGLSPAAAIALDQQEVSRTVTTSIYYSMTASEDGILDVTMTPISGEADLAVVHFSGSPSIESRREGAASEEVSLRVRRGDRFLIRIFSPLGRAATFRLRAAITTPLRTTELPPTAPPPPIVEGAGRTETLAVELHLGTMTQVEAAAPSFFRVRAPAGYILAVSLYPLQGDLDMTAMTQDARATWVSSSRRGMDAEHLYLPISADGNVMIRVNPHPRSAAPPFRYVVMARLLYPGMTAPEFAGMRTPAMPQADPSKVLRLP